MIKKILKILGITLLVLIVLIIILPFIFKGKIVQTVKNEINNNLNAVVDFKEYDLSIFSTFPDFMLELNDLTVVGVDEFAKDTLADIKSFYVSIDLMSVISGNNYKIKTIKLEKAKLLFKVLKGGKANWDIAKPSEDTTVTAEEEETSAFKLTLKKLIIDSAKIIYDDADLNTYVAINNLNHTLKGDFTADFTSLETKTSIETFDLIYDGVKYLNKANLDITANIDADLKTFKFTFKENEIRLNELYLGMDGFFAMPEDDYDMDLKFSAKKNEFKHFLSLVPSIYAKDFESVKTKGKLTLNGYIKGIYNEKTLPGYGINILVENAMFKYPDLPKSVDNITINTKIASKGGDADNTEIDVKKFHFEIAGNPVDIKLFVRTPVSDPQIDCSMKGKFNLAQVKEVYPLEEGEQLNGMIDADITMNGKLSSIENEKYEEFQALGQLIVSTMNYKSKDFPQGVMINKMRLEFSPQYLDLKEFDSKFGKSDFTAKGKIDNILSYVFKDEILTGNFTTNSNLMNLNEFMEDSETSTTETTSDSVELSVIEVPANIDFTMTSTFGKLIYDNLDMTNVVGIVKVKDKKVVLENLKMNLLDGQLVVNGSYDTKDINKPMIDFKLDISQFDIQKTFKSFVTVQKLAPIAEKTKGKFSTGMTLTTTLDKNMMPVFNTMSGEGYLTTSKITVEGNKALIKLSEALKSDKFKQMSLDKIQIHFKFENGKMVIEPFDFNVGKTKVNIGGYNSFDQSINYLIKLQIPKNEFGGQANGVLNNLVSQANKKGVNVSVGDVVNIDAILTGTVTNPVLKLGLKDAMNDAVDDLKKKAEEELKKKKEELEAKAKEEADRLKKEAEAKLKQETDKAKAEAERLKKEAEAKAKKEAERIKKEAEEKAKNEVKNKLKDKLKPK